MSKTSHNNPTVKELIKKLSDLPQDMPLVTDGYEDGLDTSEMMEGDLPNKQQRLVQAWMEIHKNIFQPLKEKSFFESAKVQFGTVAWSDEIDISPETLYIDAKEVN